MFPQSQKSWVALFLLCLHLWRPWHASAAGVVGTGAASSCTSAAFLAALEGGGTITFQCGPSPHTILLEAEALILAPTVLDGADKITLSGQSMRRILRVASGQSLTLQNLALIDGLTSAEGGAVYVEEQGSLLVRDCIFQNNISTQLAENYAGGGAISIERRSLTVIEDSRFVGNQAGNGGAIAIGGWNSTDLGGQLTVRNSSFEDNLATEDGSIPGGGDGGGAIYLKGGVSALIQNSRFTHNQAANGGAIHLLHAAVSIEDSWFEGNLAEHAYQIGGGGALYMDGGVDFKTGILVRRSTFLENSTNNLGGALFSFPEGTETTFLEDSVFQKNRSHGAGQGGAIYHQSASGQGSLSIERCSFLENDALSERPDGASQGGAIWLINTSAVIRNSTFYRNDASDLSLAADDWHRGFGGAIVSHALLEIINSTFAENSAGFVGGAIAPAAKGLVTARNSLFTLNTGANPWGIQPNCTRALVDGGNNLQFPAGECMPGSVGDPMLLPLSTCGSLTPYLPLALDSPGRDAGGAEFCPATDQRGALRNDGACDLGAYEITEPCMETTVPASVDWLLLALAYGLVVCGKWSRAFRATEL